MGRCPICELKPLNCDCTPEAKQLYEMEQNLEAEREELIQAAEKRGAERMLRVNLDHDFGGCMTKSAHEKLAWALWQQQTEKEKK